MPEWIISLQDREIRRFSIEEGVRMTIGRSPEADVIIDNTAVSRLHSALEMRNGLHFLEDLKSLNGTFVNGQRIGSAELISGEDEIRIGKFTLSGASQGNYLKAASSAVAVMDVDDETIFVGSKVQPISGPGRRPREKKGEHCLKIIAGNGSPAQLILDGRAIVKIGKDESADIRIPGWLVASAQCFINGGSGRFTIIPQSSFAGTWLNGLRIKEPQPLRRGDVISIRKVKIKYE
jgi:pSer/pThr/pTyr-binding forkhead associated (FHA) protein